MPLTMTLPLVEKEANHSLSNILLKMSPSMSESESSRCRKKMMIILTDFDIPEGSDVVKEFRARWEVCPIVNAMPVGSKLIYGVC